MSKKRWAGEGGESCLKHKPKIYAKADAGFPEALASLDNIHKHIHAHAHTHAEDTDRLH